MGVDTRLSATPTAHALPFTQPWIQTLILENYRSYPSFTLQCEARSVVITGPNGAGKTNILEALSLFNPGRGLRRAKLAHLLNSASPTPNWAVSITVNDGSGAYQMGTGIRINPDEVAAATDVPDHRRLIKINQVITPQSKLPEWISFVWQTPQMDTLFIDGPSVRRKFLDRIVASIFPDHTHYIYRFEHALAERSKILIQPSPDAKWLDILEQKIAEAALAIASLRRLFLEEMAPFAQTRISAFPTVALETHGLMEEWLMELSSLDVEDKIRDHLGASRAKDALNGGVPIGPHKTQVLFLYNDTPKEAEQCSTGEQKALLLGMTFALCRLHQKIFQRSPILLLDEVVAHLDQERRQDLFKEIETLRLQTWLTGTDQNVFLPFIDHAQFFAFQHGQIVSAPPTKSIF